MVSEVEEREETERSRWRRCPWLRGRSSRGRPSAVLELEIVDFAVPALKFWESVYVARVQFARRKLAPVSAHNLPATVVLLCFSKRRSLGSVTCIAPFSTMLDSFEILTTSGVVLWSKSYAPVGAHIINGLINDVFIEEKVRPQVPTVDGGLSPVYKKEKYTLKWKRVRELGLIFVVSMKLPFRYLTPMLTSATVPGRLPVPASSQLDR